MHEPANAVIPIPTWIAGTCRTVTFSDGVEAVLLYSTRALADKNCLPDDLSWSQPSRSSLVNYLRKKQEHGSRAVVLDFHPATAKESPPPARHDIGSLIAYLESGE